MKKRILSLALVSIIGLGTLYSAPSEAGRYGYYKNFRIFKNKYKPVVEEPSVQEPVQGDDTQLGAAIDMPENGVNVADFGAVADANYYNPSNGNYYSDAAFTKPATDATEAINSAIQYAKMNGIADVNIPSGNYLINPKITTIWHRVDGGIELESNMNLNMAKDTKLTMNNMNVNGYSLISIDNKENVKISGGKIVGDMDTHPADAHNQCYGVTIANGSKNVTVENMEITKCEDDGIMIVDYWADLSGGTRSSDIDIVNVKSHHNGRQGLTISTGSNIRVMDSEFSHQTKHDPKSGIDIEIESYDHVGVENVEISGNKFEGNFHSGVMFSDMFNEKPQSMSTNIKISGNTVSGSNHGFELAGQSKGIEITGNDITVNNLDPNQPSVGIGTISNNSENVVISNNRIKSDDTKDNFTSGIYNSTPGTKVSGNILSGQRIGLKLLGGREQVLNNNISRVLSSAIYISGKGQQNISENEVSISGAAHMASGSNHNVVYAVEAEDILIKNNNFHDMKSYGINLGAGVRNTDIVGNVMKNIGTEAWPSKNCFLMVSDGNAGINIDGNTFDKGTYPTLHLGVNYSNSIIGANNFINNKLVGFESYGYGMNDGGFVLQGNQGI